MSPRTAKQFEAIREERKAAILEAALHVFAEEGYHASSVSRIAKRAGISKGLMYNYFESKKDVLVQLASEIFDHAISMMNIQPNEKVDDARLEEMIRLSVDIALQEPKKWRLYMSLAFQMDVTEILMAEMLPRTEPYLASLITYFKNRGYDDPIARMRYFNAVLDGVQMHCLLDPEHFPAEKAKQYLIEHFI